VNKTITFLLIFFFSTNCSLDSTTGFWSKSEKLKTENTLIEKEIFQESKIYEKEFNPNLKIKLKNNFKNKSFINNLSNNNGVVNFKGSLKKVSKYKFSKISQFDYFQPELLLTNRNSLKISSVKKSQFLIIAGKPIGEPIVRGGPFVMNTKQEILKAVQDYQSGNFVQK